MSKFSKIFLAMSLLFGLAACAADVVQHNNKGNQLFAGGEYEQAVTEYQLAQVDDPDRAEPYFNASNAYNHKGNVDAALSQAQQALKTADGGLAAHTWYNLGNAFFNAEQWPQAVAAYQEALRLLPDDMDAKHNLELALKKLEQQEQQEQQEQEQQEQEQSGAATPTPSTDSSADQSTPTPASSASEGSSEPAEGMSVEQALQLLQALAENSQTLQEKLQEMNQTLPYSSGQDW